MPKRYSPGRTECATVGERLVSGFDTYRSVDVISRLNPYETACRRNILGRFSADTNQNIGQIMIAESRARYRGYIHRKETCNDCRSQRFRWFLIHPVYLQTRMRAKRLLPGILLSVAGLAIFFVNSGFGFSGPKLPTTSLGYVSWILILIGTGLLKIGASK